ncbi:uncharacterized protein TRAVEDRAFT_66236 [Trametes versicolor FP-101664 SS1]|uniref:uncharacterized protein n=1 Tax=Trametes versicolor (strain FP-101664) TaxID=717944 RepID=UPI0004624055|nr:uncharacterized protein TRAVEDRAFT_66236 [Trametes versicolor FP-101664 SS1]EIW56166.1 hypothetical protein TRAVEDRAFT_66236 [Trametes versicolor FP-101664 SS1]
MSYDQKVTWTKGKIRKMITKRLRAACKDDTATMHWGTYWSHIVARHGVCIEGWPHELVPFRDLSGATSSLVRLELLWLRWKVGTTRFREVGAEEMERLEAVGLFARTARPRRADAGLIRGRRRDPATRSKRLGPYTIKSALIVPDGADDSDYHD